MKTTKGSHFYTNKNSYSRGLLEKRQKVSSLDANVFQFTQRYISMIEK